MATYNWSDLQTGYGLASAPGFAWGRQGGNPQWLTPPDFVELIVTAARTDDPKTASGQLRETPPQFGIEYIESMSDRLTELGMEDFLFRQAYTFHLVRVPAALEGRAMRGLLTWFNGEKRPLRVDAVEENWTLYLSASSLGLPFTIGGFHQQFLKRMNVADAQAEVVRPDPVRVAVLDSGSDNTIQLKTFWDVEPPGPNKPPAVAALPYDHDGHGTAMATLIQQVTPNAELYIIRVLDRVKVNLWHLMAGVEIAVGKCDAEIVSMSLGIDKFLTTCSRCGAPAAVRQFAFEQVLSSTTSAAGTHPVYVAATGNEGSTSSFNFPASTGRCLAVGAVDSSDYRTAVSNYGGTTQYYAMTPGGQGDPDNNQPITEDVGNGGNGDACFATSVSTAYAAGMLALMRGMSRFTHLSNAELLDEMLQNHCDMPSHGTASEYGKGVISYKKEEATKPIPLATGSIVQTASAVYFGPIRVEKRK